MADTSSITELGPRAKAAARVLATTSTEPKDAALRAGADLLVDRSAGDPRRQRGRRGPGRGRRRRSPTVVDRLRAHRGPHRGHGRRAAAGRGAARSGGRGARRLGPARTACASQRVRVPLGVVAIIYENRPNVTSDAAGLCLKSGNAAFLRGSSGAIASNIAIAAVLREACAKAGLPADALVLVEDTSREAAVEFMRQRDSIDCLIPRGGPSLIRSILDNATVPYVIDGDGNCHVYVDAIGRPRHGASTSWSTPRPSGPRCATRPRRSLVHGDVAAAFLPALAPTLERRRAGGRRTATSRSAARSPRAATDDDYASEFLDLKLAVRVVDVARRRPSTTSPGTASGHSEAIVTARPGRRRPLHPRGRRRRRRWSTPRTRFVDGEEFGFGAEIGICTQKLHARGPDGPARAHHRQVRRRAARARSAPDRARRTRLTGGSSATGSAAAMADRTASSPSPPSATASAVDYLADEGIAGVVYLADRLGSRCWSRARPAPARPSWPSRWPR